TTRSAHGRTSHRPGLVAALPALVPVPHRESMSGTTSARARAPLTGHSTAPIPSASRLCAVGGKLGKGSSSEREQSAESGYNRHQRRRQQNFNPRPGDCMGVRVGEQSFGANKPNCRNDEQNNADDDQRETLVRRRRTRQSLELRTPDRIE